MLATTRAPIPARMLRIQCERWRDRRLAGCSSRAGIQPACLCDVHCLPSHHRIIWGCSGVGIPPGLRKVRIERRLLAHGGPSPCTAAVPCSRYHDARKGAKVYEGCEADVVLLPGRVRRYRSGMLVTKLVANARLTSASRGCE